MPKSATVPVEDQFLPTDYKEPEISGAYFKVKAGETHRVRIMGSFKYPTTAIMGWEAWTTEGQPIRRDYSTNGYDELN